jgi:enoyl-CoA hydratase/carnithine racemase
MTSYDVPDELEVESDGPVRIVRLNRPDHLNATNHELHKGLAGLFPQIDADDEARAVVLTGNGRAFSAGGDFSYLDELATDAERRKETLAHGRQIVTGMVACRVPIVAAVNGPAVGLGCSLVALSDIVFIGLVNHVCPDGEVFDQALACAQRISALPRRAVEDTKRVLNMHLERAVLATLDFALSAEDRSFVSPELRANIDRFLAKNGGEEKGSA